MLRVPEPNMIGDSRSSSFRVLQRRAGKVSTLHNGCAVGWVRTENRRVNSGFRFVVRRHLPFAKSMGQGYFAEP